LPRFAGGAFAVDAAILFGEVARLPAGEPRCARRSRASSTAFTCTTWRPTLAGKKKTTFAKLHREQKVREKREARGLRKEQRQREGDAGGEMQDQVEDLSHLDVTAVEGVEPDVTIKR
jgi:hypothetical protein